MSLDSSTVPEFPFLKQIERFLLSIVFDIIILSSFVQLISVLIEINMLFAGTLRRVTVSFPYITSTFSVLQLYVKLSEIPVT